MSVRGYLCATVEVARSTIRAIDVARHPDGNEQVRLPTGALEIRPAKRWSRAMGLLDGTYLVPYKRAQIGPHAGSIVSVDSVPVRIPLEAETVTRTEAQRDRSRDEDVPRLADAGAGGGGSAPGRIR